MICKSTEAQYYTPETNIITALFITAKNWNQPKQPSVKEKKNYSTSIQWNATQQ